MSTKLILKLSWWRNARITTTCMCSITSMRKFYLWIRAIIRASILKRHKLSSWGLPDLSKNRGAVVLSIVVHAAVRILLYALWCQGAVWYDFEVHLELASFERGSHTTPFQIVHIVYEGCEGGYCCRRVVQTVTTGEFHWWRLLACMAWRANFFSPWVWIKY